MSRALVIEGNLGLGRVRPLFHATGVGGPVQTSASSGQELDWCCHIWQVMAEVTSVLPSSCDCILCHVTLYLLPLKRLLFPLSLSSYVEVLTKLFELDWKIIQQIFSHFPIPLEQSIFSCSIDFGLGHLTCFGQRM